MVLKALKPRSAIKRHGPEIGLRLTRVTRAYIDFVFRENRLTNDACWRIWSVLQFAYDSTSISDEAKVKKAQIEYNAGSYLHCDDAMQAYLQSIWSAPDMNDLLTRAPGYFIPSDGENTTLASVIHLYACYLLLQEERG